MKTFTATQLNKSAQEVFAAVNEDGSVEIKHDRYPGKDFVILRRKNIVAFEFVREMEDYYAGSMLESLNAMFDAHDNEGCGWYSSEPWCTHYDKLRNMLGRKDAFYHGE